MGEGFFRVVFALFPGPGVWHFPIHSTTLRALVPLGLHSEIALSVGSAARTGLGRPNGELLGGRRGRLPFHELALCWAPVGQSLAEPGLDLTLGGLVGLEGLKAVEGLKGVVGETPGLPAGAAELGRRKAGQGEPRALCLAELGLCLARRGWE